jgi:hypothetical protein
LERNIIDLGAEPIRVVNASNVPVFCHAKDQLSPIGIGEANEILGQLAVGIEPLFEVGMQILPSLYAFL